jgi:hypothetical protein
MSIQTNTPLNCQTPTTCNFNVNTKLFDVDLTDINCSNDLWSYSTDRNLNIANQVTSDYYLKPDVSLSNCQLINNPSSPQLSKIIKIYVKRVIFD